MLNALDSTLNKLARFDEGNLLAPILSLTYKQGISSSGRDIGKQYISFVSNCCDLIRHKINDEIWIVSVLEDWYAAQMNTICNWLGERIDHSLHDVQLVALTNIMPKIYADMSLQGVSEDKLNLKTYQTIMNRLKMEEAASLASGELFEQQPSTSIFNMKFYWSLLDVLGPGGLEMLNSSLTNLNLAKKSFHTRSQPVTHTHTRNIHKGIINTL